MRFFFDRRPDIDCKLIQKGIHIDVDGGSRLCCMSTQDVSLERLISGRKRVFDRKWIQKNCEKCIRSDQYNEISMRKHINDQYDCGYLDPSYGMYLDLRLSNLCNLACQSCNDHYSSKWGALTKKGKTLSVAMGSEDILKIAKMSRNGLIHFAGGEPLIIEKHMQLLEELHSSGEAANIRLQFTTNLSILSDRSINLLKNFKSVRFCVSIDSGDFSNEYIRYPLKNLNLMKNIEKIIKELPESELLIQPTLSLLNIFNLKSFKILLDTIFMELNKSIYVYPHQLFDPAILNIFKSPVGLKETMQLEIESCLSEWVGDERLDSFSKLLIKVRQNLFTDQSQFSSEEIYDYLLQRDEVRAVSLLKGNPLLFEALHKAH